MVKRFDHVTIAVRDLDRAKAFFGLLGFVEDKAVVISGPIFSAYMGVDGIEADHVTLALAGAEPRLEVQILRYHHPDPLPDYRTSSGSTSWDSTTSASPSTTSRRRWQSSARTASRCAIHYSTSTRAS